MLFFVLELMSRFELPTLPTVRQDRAASPRTRLPRASCLTGLPPRFLRHRRRSAPPPLPKIGSSCDSQFDLRANTKTKKQRPAWGAAFCFGADEQIRTAYLLITNEVLYRLSYISARNEHYSEAGRSLQVFFRNLSYSSTRITLSTSLTQDSASIRLSASCTLNSLARWVRKVIRDDIPSVSPS